MDINVNNIVSGLTKNADKIGTLAGVLMPLSDYGIMENINLAIEKHDLEGALAWVTDLNNYTQWPAGKKVLDLAIKAYIAGYVIDEFNIPVAKRFGKPLKKFAVGSAMGLPVAMFIMGLGREAQNRNPSGGNSSGNSPSWRYTS